MIQGQFMQPSVWLPQAFAQGMELAHARKRLQQADQSLKMQMEQWMAEQKRLKSLDSFAREKDAYARTKDARDFSLNQARLGVDVGNLAARNRGIDLQRDAFSADTARAERQDATRDRILGFVEPQLPKAETTDGRGFAQRSSLFPGGGGGSSGYQKPSVRVTERGFTLGLDPQNAESATGQLPSFSEALSKYRELEPGTGINIKYADQHGNVGTFRADKPVTSTSGKSIEDLLESKEEEWRKIDKELSKETGKGDDANVDLMNWLMLDLKRIQDELVELQSQAPAKKSSSKEPKEKSKAQRAYSYYYVQ